MNRFQTEPQMHSAHERILINVVLLLNLECIFISLN